MAEPRLPLLVEDASRPDTEDVNILFILYHNYRKYLDNPFQLGPRWLSQMYVRLFTRRSLVQSRQVQHHSFVEIDHEIFSTVILSLPLIQEGHLSGTGKRMCTSTG